MAKRAGPFAEQGNSAHRGGVIAAAVLTLSILGSDGNSAWAQDRSRPAIKIAATIQARVAETIALPIQIGPAGLIPRQSFVRIRGLPPTVALSEGHSIAVGAWAVPLTALPRLRIEVPVGSEGKSEITIRLVAVDGTVLDEARSTLVIAASPRERPAASAPAAPSAAAVFRAQPEQPPVPPASVPRLAPADRERTLKMLQRGNELMAAKDFSAAQHFYKRAAEMGLAEAALALARTFDPGEQARVGAVGLMPNPEMARTWYEKARALGSNEADDFLLRLSAAR